MGTKIRLLLIFSFTLLFTLLFYKKSPGLNLAVFELGFIAIMLSFRNIHLTFRMVMVVFAGTLLSLMAFLFHFSVLALMVNILSMILLTAVIMKPRMRSMISAAGMAAANLFLSIPQSVGQLNNLKPGGMKLDRFMKITGILLIPIVIIGFFLLVYRYSNPVFADMILEISTWLDSLLTWIFSSVNMILLFTIVFGLIISTILFVHKKHRGIDQWDDNGEDTILRKRIKRWKNLGMTALKNERLAGIFLLIVLNVLILIINIIDIKWVWFGFEWEGQYLKQFVHEGTYLLILSILVSIVIVLYYFRRNLNFLSTNRPLKMLSYAWLGQNAFLTVSVAIRNIHYINNFGLAYKRIGVMFFLLLVLYGIYTVIVKVRDRKSVFYLLRKNSLAIYIVLVIMALFNWDVIIAKYNFSHYKTAFIHYDFMADLSDKTLPWLDKSMEDLEMMEPAQNAKFKFRTDNYMDAWAYSDRIEWRKQRFMKKWENKSWVEWNYAEWQAYTILKTSED